MPVFNYTEGLPNPPNLPANDVGTMQSNSVSINRIFSNVVNPNLDNIGFNNANGGYHNQISMPNQANPGVPAGMNGVLYADIQDPPGGGVNSWPIWSNGLGTMPLAGSALPVTYQPLPRGFTTIPGGFVIQWDTVGVPPSVGAVVFPQAFPNAVYNIQVTLRSNGGAGPSATVAVSNVTQAGFNFTISNNAANFYNGIYWIALGW